MAKKAMTMRRDDLIHSHRNSTTASPIFRSSMAGNNAMMADGFSTRTRLRPGGPPIPFGGGHNPNEIPLHHYGTTARRNGSLPSFEEINMRPLNNGGHCSGLGGQPQQPPNSSNFLLNRRPLYGTMASRTPATPLVKQRTAGCASPRVQMYRTRVVYSDARDAIKAQEAAV